MMGIRVVAVLLCFWTLTLVAAALVASGCRPQDVLPLALVCGAVWPVAVDYRWRRDAESYAEDAIRAGVSPAFFGWQGAVKRAVDIAVSLAVLVITAPLSLLIALAILLEDGPPILLATERLGRGMQPFRQLAFRTIQSERVALGRLAGALQPAWSMAEDARRTRIGRAIRRAHLDAIPSFWNVLRGDMSVIGPQPERSPAALFVRPGIVAPSMPQQYVQTWSLWADMKALWARLRR